jgi:hypothetical protein
MYFTEGWGGKCIVHSLEAQLRKTWRHSLSPFRKGMESNAQSGYLSPLILKRASSTISASCPEPNFAEPWSDTPTTRVIDGFKSHMGPKKPTQVIKLAGPSGTGRPAKSIAKVGVSAEKNKTALEILKIWLAKCIKNYDRTGNSQNLTCQIHEVNDITKFTILRCSLRTGNWGLANGPPPHLSLGLNGFSNSSKANRLVAFPVWFRWFFST